MIDAYARRIVGWQVSRTAHAGFLLDATVQALHDRRPSEPQLSSECESDALLLVKEQSEHPKIWTVIEALLTGQDRPRGATALQHVSRRGEHVDGVTAKVQASTQKRFAVNHS